MVSDAVMRTIDANSVIKIPFHDIDLMSIAWHGHYAKYFEIARCELFEKIGYGYQQMLESHYSWPVIELHIRYVKPAEFGREINVNAKIVEYENRLKIQYLITDIESGQRLTKGYSIQVAVDMETNEMCLASPNVLLEKLGVKV